MMQTGIAGSDGILSACTVQKVRYVSEPSYINRNFINFGSLSANERSYIMRCIRDNDSKPEMLLRRYPHGQSALYSLIMPRCPKIVLTGRGIVIFVQGCF